MNKSHLSRTNNPHAVVTANDIGSFVSVRGVGKGILHYVGEVHGREGLYCGVELETPTGKHDGTYQGVVYFVCPPYHGIFAPLYRVELDEIDDVPMLTASQTAKTTERLSRSALPALQLRNVFRPEDPMQASIVSEQMMEGSTFSNVSWGDPDASMLCSNTTYIIPPGRSALLEPEECDLMSISAPKSILHVDRAEDRREEEAVLGTSIVLDESRVGVENLPVVEDDDVDDDDEDDLQTPLVETQQWQPSLTKFAPPPSILESSVVVTPPSAPPANVLQEKTLNVSPVRANSRQSDDTGYNGESDASRMEHEDRIRALSKPKRVTAKKETLPVTRRRTQQRISPPHKEDDHTPEKSPKPRRRRMEKEPPPPPKFPVKPKPPSKHQLMMEAIKASIEADKHKPKKEIKSRISLLPPPRAPPPPHSENGTDEKMSETPKRVTKHPLKSVNAMPPKPAEPRPKKERKPLYVPPPPKERKEVKTSTPNVKATEKHIETPNVSRIEDTPARLGKSKPQFPTSSFAGGRPMVKTRHSSTKLNGTAAPTEISNTEKLQRLRFATRAFDAICILIAKSEAERERTRRELEEANEKIARQTEILEDLRSCLGQREKLHHDDLERHKNHNEQVARSHADTVERLKERYEAQLAEKAKENDRALEDERTRHEAELEAMSRRHQKVVISLDEKIAEGEKMVEKLTADKKALQIALANDSDQRNQMLTKEINSLQTALEFKSSEMKDLRQKYQQVALRVEEIPIKELEITKLKHKVIELKQALDQKLSYEKILVHQNEELKRQQLAIEEERESMQRSFDVMVYRYETGDELDQSIGSQKQKQTPAKVQFRSRSSNSDRPQSARLSQISCDMDRSADRDSLIRSTVSMYASQVQLPDNHADDVIYAPDEIITSSVVYNNRAPTSSYCSRDDVERSVNGNLHMQADSGIGL
ncbi:unnamed protein product [Cylicocyclus nassatus]|uniref:CAP-Gly domain-containing protein n=1 Tax=Cylicocyclus nassatus TaxID=53992 RepID=A0AA36M7H0_CYLNA|nr:unnamed protein product [Cylicocyclus nassatus]